jgi:hypothetical protein
VCEKSPPSATPRPRTLIVVEPLRDDPRPLEVRERLALKAMLRRFGLRCLSIRDVTPPPEQQPAGTEDRER